MTRPIPGDAKAFFDLANRFVAQDRKMMDDDLARMLAEFTPPAP